MCYATEIECFANGWKYRLPLTLSIDVMCRMISFKFRAEMSHGGVLYEIKLL